MARTRRSHGAAGSKHPSTSPRVGSPGRRERLAYTSPRAILTFSAVAVAATAFDLASKHYVFEALLSRPGQRVNIIPSVLRFTLSANPGIVFGLRVPGGIVLAATLAAMAVVTVLFAGSGRRHWGLHTALAMVMGGAVGNLYDRVFAKVRLAGEAAAVGGRMHDFIDVCAINYPVFNVADMLLVIGLGLIMLHTIRQGRRSQT